VGGFVFLGLRLVTGPASPPPPLYGPRLTPLQVCSLPPFFPYRALAGHLTMSLNFSHQRGPKQNQKKKNQPFGPPGCPSFPPGFMEKTLPIADIFCARGGTTWANHRGGGAVLSFRFLRTPIFSLPFSGPQTVGSGFFQLEGAIGGKFGGTPLGPPFLDDSMGDVSHPTGQPPQASGLLPFSCPFWKGTGRGAP